jgi:hypothetical protein
MRRLRTVDRANRSRRPSAFGRIGGFGFLAACILVVAAAARAVTSPTAEAQIDIIVWSSVSAVALLAAVLLVPVLWKARSVRLARVLLGHRRNARVAVCTGATTTSDALARVNRLSITVAGAGARKVNAAAGRSPNRLPSWIAVLADARGVQLWAAGRPRYAILNLRWEDVSDVRVAEVEELTRRSNCFVLDVPAGEEHIRVPLVVVGAGLGGLFPLQIADLERLSRTLNEYRLTTSP